MNYTVNDFYQTFHGKIKLLSGQESVFRYADYKKFPIFLIDDDKLFFENIIYEVFRKIEMMRDVVFIQQELDLLLKQKLSADEIKEHAKRIFPSCGEQFFVIYAEQNSNSAFFSFEEIEHRFKKSPLKNSTNTVLPYREGFFFIYSDEEISSKLSDSQVQSILESLIQVSEQMRIGVSDYHLKLDEFDLALQESLYASRYPYAASELFTRYSSLGINRLLFAFCNSLEARRYMRYILKKISDYDIENNAQLLQTVEAYINCECNLSETALVLSKHRNTINYHFTKIQELTGLDCKKFSDLEQISIALKIYHHERFL